MLALPALALSLAAVGQPVDTPAVRCSGTAFSVFANGKKDFIPISAPKPKEVRQALYRKDGTFAVWDERGLSIRAKNRTKSWDLGDVSLTPKLFSRDEILETRRLIAEGKRKRAASGLSGSRRIGTDAFFLVRWNETGGVAWLEALVKVDLQAEQPVPELVGRFPGVSLSNRNLDDNLLLLGTGLAVVARGQDDGWGVATYDPQAKSFGMVPIGTQLHDYHPISTRLGIFVEKTPYGTFLTGRVDLLKGVRRDLAETRAPATPVDEKRPTIARVGPDRLRNLETGAEATIAESSAVRRTQCGILVWTPSNKPTSAVLLEQDDLIPLARWKAPVPSTKR